MSALRSLIRGAALALGLSGGAVGAETLRPAPDYYAPTLFALSMAEALASACPDIGMDLLAANAAGDALRARLAEDGFDLADPGAQMIDPSPEFAALQADFLSRHPIEGAAQAAVCAAAQSELDADSLIGQFLYGDLS